MPTPNLTAGVTEAVKPRRLRSNVVWRAESTLNNGSILTSPIFDLCGDGWPYTQLEIGTELVMRIPSPWWTISVQVNNSVNMRLNMFNRVDNGGQLALRTIYVPLVQGTETKTYRYRQPCRRFQCRIQNTPVGTAAGGVNSPFFLEMVNEG